MEAAFAGYEREFTELKNGIKQRVANIPASKGEERERDIKQVQADLAAAKEVVEKMEVTGSEDPRFEAKVEGFKRELKSITALYKKALAKVGEDVDRDSLLGGVAMRDLSVTSQDHRERYANTTAKLQQSGSRIKEAISIAHTARDTAAGSMVELDRQRGVLEHASNGVGHINTNLTNAGRIMREISRRIMTNKLIMIGIILLLLTGIFLIIYFKWIRNILPSNTSGSGF